MHKYNLFVLCDQEWDTLYYSVIQVDFTFIRQSTSKSVLNIEK